MRCILKILILITINNVGLSYGSSIINPITIDLHDQRIGIWNIEEKVEPILPNPTAGEVFILDLSNNIISDLDISTIVSMIELHDLTARLEVLNLSNNRLTLEGVKELIPLLRLEQLKWLDISINNLNVPDFEDLWEEIETQARTTIIIEDLSVSEEYLRDQWAQKVVFLPKSYTVERFFSLESPFAKAHREYYKLNK